MADTLEKVVYREGDLAVSVAWTPDPRGIARVLAGAVVQGTVPLQYRVQRRGLDVRVQLRFVTQVGCIVVTALVKAARAQREVVGFSFKALGRSLARAGRGALGAAASISRGPLGALLPPGVAPALQAAHRGVRALDRGRPGAVQPVRDAAQRGHGPSRTAMHMVQLCIPARIADAA